MRFVLLLFLVVLLCIGKANSTATPIENQLANSNDVHQSRQVRGTVETVLLEKRILGIDHFIEYIIAAFNKVVGQISQFISWWLNLFSFGGNTQPTLNFSTDYALNSPTRAPPPLESLHPPKVPIEQIISLQGDGPLPAGVPGPAQFPSPFLRDGP